MPVAASVATDRAVGFDWALTSYGAADRNTTLERTKDRPETPCNGALTHLGRGKNQTVLFQLTSKRRPNHSPARSQGLGRSNESNTLGPSVPSASYWDGRTVERSLATTHPSVIVDALVLSGDVSEIDPRDFSDFAMPFASGYPSSVAVS